MAYTYEDMESPIPNATIRKRLNNGVLRTYVIEPVDGYALHLESFNQHEIEWEYDEEGNLILDEEGNPITIILSTTIGYKTSQASIIGSYDFCPIQVQDEAGNTITAYGEEKIYCKPISEVGTGA